MGNLIWLLEHKGEIMTGFAQIAAGFVTLAAVLAAWLPQSKTPGPYDGFRKVLNLIAQNYGHAKNKQE